MDVLESRESDKAKVIHALRCVVWPEIYLQKRHLENDMDHVNTGGFKRIANSFIEKEGLKVLSENVVKDVEGQFKGRKQFATLNEPYKTRFLEHHDKLAIVEEVSQEEHKRRTRERMTCLI